MFFNVYLWLYVLRCSALLKQLAYIVHSCEEEGEEGFMNIGTVIKKREYGAVNVDSEYSTVSDTY